MKSRAWKRPRLLTYARLPDEYGYPVQGDFTPGTCGLSKTCSM